MTSLVGMATDLRRKWVPKDSKFYAGLRWGYQPIKNSIEGLRMIASLRNRGAVISDYLSAPGFKGLQIGCGPGRHKGWLNTDLPDVGDVDCVLDITQPLPFPNSSLDAIYGSEVIEHIPRKQVKPFLLEARRVLKPGGVLRVTTPDPKAVCEIYLDLHKSASLDDHFTTWIEAESTPDFWLNSMFRSWGHQWLWDFDSLGKAMRSSGFSGVVTVEPQQTKSGMRELENLDIRYGMPAPAHAWTSSMIVEATR